MLKNIRWSDFLTIVLVLTATYYLAIVLLFYRSSIRGLFRKRRQSSGPRQDLPVRQKKDEPAVLQDGFAATKEASDKLKAVIDRAVADGVDREDLLQAIAVHLHPYQRLHGTAFGTAINNSITRELDQFGLSLSEDELDAMWTTK